MRQVLIVFFLFLLMLIFVTMNCKRAGIQERLAPPTFMSGGYTSNPDSYTAPACLPQAAMTCGRHSNDPNCITSALKYLQTNKYC